MSKKYCPFLYNDSLYKDGKDFLGLQNDSSNYTLFLFLFQNLGSIKALFYDIF